MDEALRAKLDEARGRLNVGRLESTPIAKTWIAQHGVGEENSDQANAERTKFRDAER